jgi:thiol-disulfide isomerase/thioredoxin
MMTLLRPAATAAVVLAFAGCAGTASSPAAATGDAVLTGTVSNAAGTTVKATVGDTTLVTEMDAEGRFRLALPVAGAGYAELRIGNEFTLAWVAPGDSLDLRVDGAQFDETITYGGSAPKPSNYLAAKFLEIEAMADAFGNPYAMGEDSFVAYADGKRDILLADLEAAGLEGEFARLERAETLMEWAAERATYPSYHRYYADAPDFSASEGYWSFVDAVDLDDEALAETGSFDLFAESWLDEELRDVEGDRADRHLARMDLIVERFANPVLRDRLLGETVLGFMRYEGAEGADVLLARLRAAGVDPDIAAKAEKAYDGWMAIAPGQPAPGFGGRTPSGEAHTLADLRGSVVYVDVWATWCGPCRAEIPALRELQAAFEGNDEVAFLSISVDEDADAWEAMVAEEALGGHQWLAPAAWDSEVVTNYRIAGIPRFLLIDQQGRVVSPSADRPSSGEVEAQIRALLETAG